MTRKSHYFPRTIRWYYFLSSRYIFLTVSVSLGVTVFLLILITCSSVYPQNCFKVSLIFCVLICSLSLSTFLQLAPSDEERSHLKDHVAPLPGDNGTTPHNSDLSEAGLFALYVQVEGDTDCHSRKHLTTSNSGFSSNLHCDTSASLRHPHSGVALHLPPRNTRRINPLWFKVKVSDKLRCLEMILHVSGMYSLSSSDSWFTLASTSSDVTSS